jgi:hypothetical protein
MANPKLADINRDFMHNYLYSDFIFNFEGEPDLDQLIQDNPDTYLLHLNNFWYNKKKG